jgi:hypothetical protein
MTKFLLSEEEVDFIERSAALVTKDDKKFFLLPVIVRDIRDTYDVYSYIDADIKDFNLKNAQEYVNLSVLEKGQLSDGYHTFNELYDHRIINFILACKTLAVDEYAPIWKSQVHSDGKVWDGWFIMGINSEPGEQISYHLPMKYWEMTKFAQEYDTAPPFDGHTSADVLTRLEKLLNELD